MTIISMKTLILATLSSIRTSANSETDSGFEKNVHILFSKKQKGVCGFQFPRTETRTGLVAPKTSIVGRFQVSRSQKQEIRLFSRSREGNAKVTLLVGRNINSLLPLIVYIL